MTDIFQFSNVYSVTQNISHLLHSTSLQTECVNFVSRYGNYLSKHLN